MLLLPPVALFQKLEGTAPAVSVEAMATSPPTKSTLITGAAVVKGFTVKVTVAVCVIAPLVPVMVSVGLPEGVLMLVVTVSVEGVPALMEVGLNTAVAPVGRPLMVKPTVPVKPFTAATFTV